MEEISLISTAGSLENERLESIGQGVIDEQDAQLDSMESDHLQRRNIDDGEIRIEKPTFSSPSTELKRLTGLFWFFLLYSALAVASWVIICILTYRPLPKGTYVNVYNDAKPNYEDANDALLGTREWELKGLYETSHRWYQAAQVMQAIVALFTFTFTSLICSKCVVVYLQKTKYDVTLRQALTLADKNWLNLNFYLDIPRAKKTHARSTKPLYIFMAVTLIGGFIPLIQRIVTSETTIKVPLNLLTGYTMTKTVDIGDILKPNSGRAWNSKLSVTAQKIFASTPIQQIIPNLWIDEDTTLRCQDSGAEWGQVSRQVLPQLQVCDHGVAQTYGDAPTENPPFLTHIPAFKNTGLIKQFVPRMNSSVRYFEVDAFPSGCNEESSGFFVEYVFNSTYYEHSASWYNFSVKACSLSIEPPWKPIRDRQDIEENFYVQMKLSQNIPGHPSYNITTFQAQANTSLGWFELPNYANNNTAGPLLEKDPFPCESSACADQAQDILFKRQHDRHKENKKFMNQSSGAFELSIRKNLGPLALTMVALFGKESWFSLQTYMALQGFVWPLSLDVQKLEDEICADTAPLSLLNGLDQYELECISGENSQYYNTGSIPAAWLEQFFDARGFQATLGSAVILASNLWLSNPFSINNIDLSLSVFSDMGMSTTIPTISKSSIIVVSALWGIYLTFLLALICYAVSTKVWTNSMDAFTLVKMGSVLHDKIALLPSGDESEVKALDELPGWFGDENPLDKVGRVGLGAKDPLRPDRRYVSYPRKPKKA